MYSHLANVQGTNTNYLTLFLADEYARLVNSVRVSYFDHQHTTRLTPQYQSWPLHRVSGRTILGKILMQM